MRVKLPYGLRLTRDTHEWRERSGMGLHFAASVRLPAKASASLSTELRLPLLCKCRQALQPIFSRDDLRPELSADSATCMIQFCRAVAAKESSRMRCHAFTSHAPPTPKSHLRIARLLHLHAAVQVQLKPQADSLLGESQRHRAALHKCPALMMRTSSPAPSRLDALAQMVTPLSPLFAVPRTCAISRATRNATSSALLSSAAWSASPTLSASCTSMRLHPGRQAGQRCARKRPWSTHPPTSSIVTPTCR